MLRIFLSALLVVVLPVAMSQAQEAAPTDEVAALFPQGVDWNNATPEQMYSAIYNAVKKNPDATLDIVQSTLNNIERTGRYPRAGNGGGKEVVEEDDGRPRPPQTFEDMALEVGKAATAANPAMAPSIANLISGLVPTLPPQTVTNAITGAQPPPDTGGGDGGGTPGVFLPSGGGGGGGGGGNPSS